VGTVRPTVGQTYTASDILQTNPSTVVNPAYLASAGIQIGPGVDLVTKTAGGAPFSTYTYPTTIFYGCRNTITNEKSGYFKSNGEARRALVANSISVNKEKVTEEFQLTSSNLINNQFVLLQSGKKNYFVIRVK
jgi:hypothetical protein